MIVRLFVSGTLLVVVLGLAMCTVPAPSPTPVPTISVAPTATPVPVERQQATVLRIVDGDTIVVDLDGARYSVRYIGIDTPETHHPTDGADYWGFEASEANQSMVQEGMTVTLQRDISETDIYGRLLRYIWVEDTLVNAELVRIGLARVLFYEPDVLYQHEVKKAEAEAQAARRGLYGPVPTPPAEKPLLYDPARGDPVMSLPVQLKVRVVDAFWVPEESEWWYWIGINGFNGWVTGDSITREAPATPAQGPAATFDAYDWGVIAEQTVLDDWPGETGRAVGSLEPGTSVQVKGLSWEERTDRWWFYVESMAGEGWVPLDLVDK